MHEQMKGLQNKASYGIVLLAAGMSSRLGRPKQLLAYQGDYLLSHAIKATEQVKDAVTAVIIGAEAELLLNEIKNLDVKVVLNQQFKEGMSSSIRCGVQYIQDYDRNIENIIMMVCDQPYVNGAHILKLIACHEATGAKIVASTYSDRKGVPALFNKQLFPELLRLKGDTGAKELIKKYNVETATVFLPLGEIDIDTEENYNMLINASSVRQEISNRES